MGKYLEQLNPEIKAYFNILSSDFPYWLEEYINTHEMQRIGKISIDCGMCYVKSFHVKYFYSNLDHSVGVALIIWHFTHDKKQTLAGLFHDIATPVFKHCIDIMNGDVERQESTEDKTIEIIKNSQDIMYLLNKDNIKLEEVCDYKLYPIADNKLPMLSADRFEYNFSSGLSFYRAWNLENIREIYENIIIVKNEHGSDELAFKDKKICEKYIRIVSKLWPEWISDKDRIAMQFIADICHSLHKINKLSMSDLYELSEEEVIKRIIKCDDKYLSDSWKKFINIKRAFVSDKLIRNKYCVNIKAKRRYLNPLVLINDKVFRIYDVSDEAKKNIDDYLALPNDGYVYFNFDFKPY